MSAQAPKGDCLQDEAERPLLMNTHKEHLMASPCCSTFPPTAVCMLDLTFITVYIKDDIIIVHVCTSSHGDCLQDEAERPILVNTHNEHPTASPCCSAFPPRAACMLHLTFITVHIQDHIILVHVCTSSQGDCLQDEAEGPILVKRHKEHLMASPCCSAFPPTAACMLDLTFITVHIQDHI